MFHGSITALVTPFADGLLDSAALARMVKHQLDSGSQGLVPVGTTGESPTLSSAEHHRAIEVVVQEVSGQVPVIAGAGSNNTAEAIAYNQHAAKVGADAALHVMGYYNRPNQEGIFQHFQALDKAGDLPMLAYNVPARAVIDIQPETMARLARLPTVVGVKDATCDLSRPLRERALIAKPFCFLSGEDPTAVAYNANGGVGCITVTANVAPALSQQMQQACADQDFKLALKLQLQLMPLHRALFIEPSPAGVKYACSLLGLCEPACRLPMVDLEDETKFAIRSAMLSVGLL